jgi:hypothetical protein
LTVQADGRARTEALLSGIYDVTAFLSDAKKGVQLAGAIEGTHSGWAGPPTASGVLDLSADAPLGRVTEELSLRRNQ